ncbi:acetylornithine transaminase [Methanomethylovorans sp.]|uniref:acetylornithine transaminase n=1 Tax=Methanomethylovorans sp. TaxID=2758717 RepID=UPI000A6B5A48|nr:acetylornithine transaminase [Methanomethylovorans sp.]
MSSTNYESIAQKDAAHVMQTYGRQPVALVSGKGAVVSDVNGMEYIDCVAGIAVNNVGHCHPKVVEAIKSQAEKLIHVSNLYYTEVQANLAEELVKLTGMERAFFCNSGAEAVEAAMKLARTTTGKTDFIAAERSFHGRTMGSLSVTYKEMYRTPFRPLVQEEIFVPYDNADAMAEAITEKTAAIIIEPIQGEGGIHVPSGSYLQEVRSICDEHGILLIFDEVQTGFGRTGKWFCKDHSGIQPDIMCMAKAMGGGFPMGGIVAKKGITFNKGQHASTFGGNPLACAAALGSITAIKEDGLLEHTTEIGKYFMDKLREADIPGFKEVRGLGLMIGLELERNCTEIVDHARKHGVLLNNTSETVIRLAPPLVITKDQIDKVVEVIEQA